MCHNDLIRAPASMTSPSNPAPRSRGERRRRTCRFRAAEARAWLRASCALGALESLPVCRPSLKLRPAWRWGHGAVRTLARCRAAAAPKVASLAAGMPRIGNLAGALSYTCPCATTCDWTETVHHLVTRNGAQTVHVTGGRDWGSLLRVVVRRPRIPVGDALLHLACKLGVEVDRRPGHKLARC